MDLTDTHTTAAEADAGPVGRLALWTDARLPLPAVLRSMAAESAPGGRRGLLELARRVESGDSLEEAFRQSAGAFPRTMRRELSLVEGLGGDLRTALPAIAGMIAAQKRVRRELTATLAYPIAVGLLVTGLVLMASLTIIPQFAELYGEFGIELPVATEFIIDLGSTAPWAIAIVGAASAAVFVLSFVPGTARFVHWFLNSPPFFGRLWTYEGHQAVARLLHAYLSTQMPLPAALRSAAAGHFDRNLARALRLAADRCEAGESLSDSLGRSIHFEREFVAIVRDGERRGATPAALAEAGAVYADSRRDQMELIGRVIPPVMLLAVGAFLVLLTAALFLPMVRLIEGLT